MYSVCWKWKFGKRTLNPFVAGTIFPKIAYSFLWYYIGGIVNYFPPSAMCSCPCYCIYSYLANHIIGIGKSYQKLDMKYARFGFNYYFMHRVLLDGFYAS